MKCFYYPSQQQTEQQSNRQQQPMIILADTQSVDSLEEFQTYIMEEFQHLDDHAFPTANKPQHHHHVRHMTSHPHTQTFQKLIVDHPDPTCGNTVEWKFKDKDGDFISLSKRTTLDQISSHSVSMHIYEK